MIVEGHVTAFDYASVLLQISIYTICQFDYNEWLRRIKASHHKVQFLHAGGEIFISRFVQKNDLTAAASGLPLRQPWILAAIVFQCLCLVVVLAAPEPQTMPSTFPDLVVFWSSTLSLSVGVLLIGAKVAFEPLSHRKLPWLFLLLMLSFLLIGDVMENADWLRGRIKIFDINDCFFVFAKFTTLFVQTYALRRLVTDQRLKSIGLDILTSLVAVGLVAWLLALTAEKSDFSLTAVDQAAMLFYSFLDLFIIFNCLTIGLRIGGFDKFADKITVNIVILGIFFLSCSDLYWTILKIQGLEVSSKSPSLLLAHSSYLIFSLSVFWSNRAALNDFSPKTENKDVAEDLIPFFHVLMSFGLIYLLGFRFFQPFGQKIYPILVLTVVMLMLRQAMHFRTLSSLQTQLAISATEAQLARMKHYEIENLKRRSSQQIGVGQERIDHLRRAIDMGQFEPWYQPIYDSLTGQIHSIEVLCRYNHPEEGVILPKHFISDIEDASLSSHLALSMLPAALRDLQLLKNAGLISPETSLNINATAHDLHDSEFLDGVVKLAQQHRVKLSCLTLELTERLAADENLLETEGLKKLRLLGVRLAIDDFGTGYSSLSYIDQLRPDIIKIGQGFVDNIVTRPNLAKVLKSIADMAARLNIQLVVEGVETKGQLYLIQEIGCALVQGYLFAKPMAYPDLVGGLKYAIKLRDE
jgi:EAL domain-containing protein (putative c-di-GMP-specific phosphodiesterase class I)